MSSSKIIYLKNDFLNNPINGFNSYLNPLVSSQPSLSGHQSHHQQSPQQLSSSQLSMGIGSPMSNGKLGHASSSSKNNLVYVSPTQEFEKGKKQTIHIFFQIFIKLSKRKILFFCTQFVLFL
jgi:hypothetical protein